MDNIILKSMLSEFSAKNSLNDTESFKFEKFVSHSILANDYYDSLELDLVSTGHCVGVDAIAIAINDILVYTEEQASGMVRGQFEASFIFIQTKTSTKIDLGDYLKFLTTAYIFFTKEEEAQPEELKTLFKIKTMIYDLFRLG